MISARRRRRRTPPVIRQVVSRLSRLSDRGRGTGVPRAHLHVRDFVDLGEERRSLALSVHHVRHEAAARRDDEHQGHGHRGRDVDDLLLAAGGPAGVVPRLEPLAIHLAAGGADESLVARASSRHFAVAAVLAVGPVDADAHVDLLAARSPDVGRAVARRVGVVGALAAVEALVATGDDADVRGLRFLATSARETDGALAASKVGAAHSVVATPTSACASSDAGGLALDPFGTARADADVIARGGVSGVTRATVEAFMNADGGDARAIVAVQQAGAIPRERPCRRQGEE
mmetsp:Transcript_4529/g.18626  ORF Transcript_4529/g.18626 Transcript_4529/m.18626 type:complete len:289 (+) Transcript_4529:130-996(+)